MANLDDFRECYRDIAEMTDEDLETIARRHPQFPFEALREARDKIRGEFAPGSSLEKAPASIMGFTVHPPHTN